MSWCTSLMSITKIFLEIYLWSFVCVCLFVGCWNYSRMFFWRKLPWCSLMLLFSHDRFDSPSLRWDEDLIPLETWRFEFNLPTLHECVRDRLEENSRREKTTLVLSTTMYFIRSFIDGVTFIWTQFWRVQTCVEILAPRFAHRSSQRLTLQLHDWIIRLLCHIFKSTVK